MIRQFIGAQIGSIHLTYGPHQIDVALDNPSEDVFLAIYDGAHQVCGGSPSQARAMPSENGFMLIADIKSDNATVVWMAF